MVNVLIISSYQLICASLSQIIDNVSEFNLVDVIETYDEVPSFIENNAVDVVLFEVCPPDVEHFNLVRKIRKLRPRIKVLILCTKADDPLPNLFLQAGAEGFITRQCSLEEIIVALKEVSMGQRYISADCAQQMALGRVDDASSAFAALSGREMQVMMMITSGCKVMSISDKLCLSPKTINTYRYRLFSKLGVDSDVSLTRLAIRQGLMDA